MSQTKENFKRFSSIIVLKGYNLCPVVSDKIFTKNLQKFAKKKAKISPKIRPKRVLKKSGPCCEWVNEVFFRVKRNQILKISLRRVEGEIEI